MFWIEESEDGNTFVLFSQLSTDDWADELSGMEGLFLEEIQSKNSGSRQGWVFSKIARAQVDAFIERETNDIRSNSSDGLSLEDLYDLLVEAFDRIAALEKKVEE
jgi:hypothetical protein